MNIATILGIVVGIVILALATFFSTPDVWVFVNLAGLAIVIGGTAAATFICYPLKEVTRVLHVFLLALAREESRELLEVLVENQVALVASLPSLAASQAEAQRGKGALDHSLAMLRRLNELGYGAPGSGLGLDLVSNPTGAFLPPGQEAAEDRFFMAREQKKMKR